MPLDVVQSSQEWQVRLCPSASKACLRGLSCRHQTSFYMEVITAQIASTDRSSKELDDAKKSR